MANRHMKGGWASQVSREIHQCKWAGVFPKYSIESSLQGEEGGEIH